jgi:hypothetical protein
MTTSLNNQVLSRCAAFLTAVLLAGNAGLFLSPRASTAADPSQETFPGVQPGLGSLPLLARGRTRSISAENPTGEKGRGRNGPSPADRAQAGRQRAGGG